MYKVKTILGILLTNISLITNPLQAATNSPPVLDIPFDGNVQDVSFNHLVVYGKSGALVADRAGTPNFALSLNGTNEAVIIPFQSRMYPPQMTLSLWVNLDRFQGTILRSGDAAYDLWRGFGIYCDTWRGSICYQDYSGQGFNPPLFGSTNFLAKKKWNHLVVSRSLNSSTLYINGIKVDEKTNIQAYARTLRSAITVGASQNGGTNDFCRMGVDQFKIYDYAFSGSQALSLYTNEAPVVVPPPTPVTPTVVLDMPFDGSVADVSTNHFAVSTNSNGSFVADRAGVAQKALSLNGTNQNVSLPFNPAMYPTEMTLSLWVNMERFEGSILRSGDAMSDSWHGFSLGCDPSQGILGYQDYTGSGFNAMVSQPMSQFPLKKWNHVLISRSTNSCSMYVNGIKVDQNTNLTAYAKAANTPLSIGANQNGRFYEFCPMAIDQFKIYNYAFNASQALTLYTNEAPVVVPPPTPVTPTVVLDMPFDGSIQDLSSNQFTVVATNGGTFVADRNGVAQKAFSLNGTNENIYLPYNPAMYPTEMTLSLWVKVQKLGGLILRSGDAITDSWHGFALQADQPRGSYTYEDYTGSDFNARTIAYTNSFKIAEWNHVLVSRSSNSCSIYINGVKMAQNSNLTAYARPARSALSIGSNQNGGTFYEFCPMAIDDFKIYNYALTSSQALSLYTNEAPVVVTPPTPITPVVLDIPFDGSVADVSTNHFTVVGTNGGTFVADRAGAAQKALLLGTNKNVFLPFNSALYPTEMTLSLWVNLQQFSGTILRSGDASSDSWKGYSLWCDGASGAISYQDYTGGWYNALLYGPNSQIPLKQWNHILISRSTNRCTMYINGIKVSEKTNLTAYAKAANTPLSIGSNQDGDSFYEFCPMAIDQFKIYGSALSSAQVSLLYSMESRKYPLPLRPIPAVLKISVVNAGPVLPVTVDSSLTDGIRYVGQINLAQTEPTTRKVSVSMTVTPGLTYQLQSSSDLSSWKPEGESFTATEASVSKEIEASVSQSFFRLVEVD